MTDVFEAKVGNSGEPARRKCAGATLTRLAAFGCAALLGCTPGLAGRPEARPDYINVEYGIRASLPDRHVCTAMSGTHSIGFFVYIDGSDCSKKSPPEARRMSVAALYNASFAETPARLLQSNCKPTPDYPQRAVLPGTFGKDRLRGCRSVAASGAVMLDVVAQGGRWPDDAGDDRPWINYSFTLRTDRAHEAADTVRFRRFIDSVSLRPPSAKH